MLAEEAFNFSIYWKIMLINNLLTTKTVSVLYLKSGRFCLLNIFVLLGTDYVTFICSRNVKKLRPPRQHINVKAEIFLNNSKEFISYLQNKFQPDRLQSK